MTQQTIKLYPYELGITELADAVKGWLTTCHCIPGRAYALRLAKVTYTAVEYRQPLSDGTIRHAVYVVGDPPKDVTKRRPPEQDGPRYEIEGTVYYCAGYMANPKPEFAAYHPFGTNFILMRESASC